MISKIVQDVDVIESREKEILFAHEFIPSISPVTWIRLSINGLRLYSNIHFSNAQYSNIVELVVFLLTQLVKMRTQSLGRSFFPLVFWLSSPTVAIRSVPLEPNDAPSSDRQVIGPDFQAFSIETASWFDYTGNST